MIVLTILFAVTESAGTKGTEETTTTTTTTTKATKATEGEDAGKRIDIMRSCPALIALLPFWLLVGA
jgi:hypothetical protein